MADDRIVIGDLLVRTIIGVHDWEREQRQDVLINLELCADLRSTARRDDLEGGVDYRALTKAVIAQVEASRRHTLEALAGDIAGLCLEQAGVERVKVRVEKPGALRFARTVGIEIQRSRRDGS